ncbi:MAG TPA: secondary thiamine-phosphate synthase enzyme YjbQ [Patescibacteria group bacterium]|nr:secondary thiamine-phosphate synthase enzyme YjbQ [Patescibacteria group bacterium]
MQIIVPTTKAREVVDITDKVTRECIDFTGQVNIFVTHSSAAITTANLDPGTDQDLLDALDGLVPQAEWIHPHDPQHAPDHLLASIVGPGLVVPVVNGRLQLGTWQRIVLIEFNGPKERQVDIGLIGAQNAESNLML